MIDPPTSPWRARARRVANGLLSIPFRLSPRPPLETPQRILILQPGFLSQALLTTPLVAVLSKAYPQARIDWAISDWARPAVAGNPRLTKLISTGRFSQPIRRREDIRELVGKLRNEEYDTCFIPHRSRLLGLVAWMAGIRQRIGLDVNGGGFAHTVRVRPTAELHEAELYLSLARAMGLRGEADTEFYPTDVERIRVTEWLAGKLEWLGDVPLAILHPGGGSNPVAPEPQKQWPVERFALLGNYLVREHGARVLAVGAAGDTPLVNAVVGMMSTPAHNLAGQLSLGELGALAEVANLYVGNDTGPTHVAAAMGCPTVALFGPSDVKLSRPYTRRTHVIAMPALKHVMERTGTTTPAFSWKGNLSADEVIVAAEQLLTNAVTAENGAGE